MLGGKLRVGLVAALAVLGPAGSAAAQNEDRDTEATSAPSASPASESQGAAAMVESVANAPKAGVEFLDYVYPGQVIDLGRQGVVVLSYFDSCLIETVLGGRLTVQPGASKVSGGKVSVEQVPCQGTRMFVIAGTSEAGATVNRISEQEEDDWSEWTVKNPRPIFNWSPSAKTGRAKVTIFDMDQEPPKRIWQTRAAGNHVTYPETAPELEIGWPYRVEVRLPGGGKVTALFSVDPDLDAPDTAISRVVPVR